MKIRRFTESDLSSLHSLIHETIDASYTGIYPDRAVQFFKDFHSEKKIAERGRSGLVLVIDKGRSIAATGSLMENEIFAVFVSPALQRAGYGKAIMTELEKRAKSGGFAETQLSISLPSRRFYENLGYEVFEMKSLDVGEGQYLDYWPARKHL